MINPAMIQNILQAMQNPAAVLRSYGITANDPNSAIQSLMSSGKMSQAQYAQLRRMSEQIMSLPQFKNTVR